MTESAAQTVDELTGHGELPGAECLLATRVSLLLDAEPATLEVLIRHGFAPLEQPHLRKLLAPTVTLAQAARLRGLAGGELASLLTELLALGVAAKLARSGVGA